MIGVYHDEAIKRALINHTHKFEPYVNAIINLNINKKIMEIEIKGLRVQIDGLFELIKKLNPISTSVEHAKGLNLQYFINSHEANKAIDALKLGKAWLGKCLGAIGTASPYPKDGERKTVADIEKTADTSDTISTGHLIIDKSNGDSDDKLWDNKNHIEKVDWLRESISRKITEGTNMIENSPELKNFEETPLMWYWFESKKQLMVARFWLGFELERIKKIDESMDSKESVS